MERELNKLFNDTNYDKEHNKRDMINQTLISKLFLRSLDSELERTYDIDSLIWICLMLHEIK